MYNVGSAISLVASLKDLLRLLRDVLPFGESRYHRFFKKADFMFCVASIEGTFIDLNQRFIDELGWPREAIVGKKFMQFVHPDDRLHTIDQMTILREGGEVQGFTNRYLCRDGEYKRLEWVASGNGEIYAVAWVVDEKKEKR